MSVFLFRLFIFLFMAAGPYPGSAQISLDHLQPITLEFSGGEGTEVDIWNLSSEGQGPNSVEINPPGEEQGWQGRVFPEEKGGFPYLVIDPAEGGSWSLLNLAVVNNSIGTVDRLWLAMDLAVKPEDQQNSELMVTWRSSDFEQKELLWTSDALHSDRKKWQAEPVFLLLEDLDLGHRETVEISIDYHTEPGIDPNPVAVHRVRLTPLASGISDRGERDRAETLVIPVGEGERSWISMGNVEKTVVSMEQILPEGGDFDPQPIQVWDPRNRSFRIPAPAGSIDPMETVVIKNQDATAIRLEGFTMGEHRMDARQEVKTAAGEKRSTDTANVHSINFRLSTRGNDGQPVQDEAAVIYLHEDATHDRDPLDAEKLWLISGADESESGSLIFFAGAGQENEYLDLLSRDARPFPVSEPLELDLKHLHYHVARNHLLEWEITQDFPDLWEVTLMDLETGTVVDMKKEAELRFEALPEFADVPKKDSTLGPQPLRLSESGSRFRISIQPSNQTEVNQRTADLDPSSVELYQNYPNPFSTMTNIEFFLPEESPVRVRIYNVVGQRVAQLMDDTLPEGESPEITWDASDMPSGIYILQLEAGNRVYTRKMTLIK